MDKLLEELDAVKKILAESPKGMTISDVSDNMGINRNAVAKYLEVLRTAGEVEMKPFGRSKIFSLSSRMPLAMALSLSSDLIVLIDSDLKILDTNDQLLRFTGLNRGEIAGHSLDSIRTDILNHPNILLNIKDALNGKEYVHEISVNRGKDEYFFKIKILPVAPGGIQRRAAIIYENITARKKAEIALRESEARYRAVVEDQTELICRLLPDTTLTFVNDAWCRFFDSRRDNVLGRKLIELMPPAYSAIFQEELGSIRAGQPSVTFEGNIVMSDGQRRWIQSTYRGRFDSGGRLTEIQIVARDITERRRAEEMLRKLSRAVEDSPAAVVITDLRGDIEYVNPGFTALTGYAFEEVRGRNSRILKSGHTTQEEYRQLWETILSGNVWRGVFFNKKKNGALYWESAIISPIVGAGGTITNFVAIKEDITERRRAESALKESEARYRAIAEDHIDMIVRMLPDTTITFANDAWCRFLGQDRSQFLGTHFLGHHQLSTRMMIGDILSRIQVENDIEYSESVVRLSDGSKHWLQWTCRGIFDDSGRLGEYQIVARDVTGLKQTEIALRESEEKFRAAFDQSPIGACIVSLDFRFLRVNPEFSRIVGYTEDELLPRTFLELTHPDDRETDTRMAGELVAGRIEQYCLEKRCLTKDGRILWLRKHARLVKDLHGNPLYCLTMYEDITENKRMEESLKITQYSVDTAVDEINWLSPDGRLLYVNDVGCRRLGYSREELRNMYIYDIDPNITPARHRENFDRIRKTGNEKLESVHRRRDGTLYPIEVNATVLPIGDGECMFAYVRDITDRKAMEESMRLTQFAMDNAMEGIIWIDDTGQLVYVNQAVIDQLKYSREELLRMKVWDINPTYDRREKWQERYDESKRLGMLQYESVHRASDGTIIPIEVFVSNLQYDHKEYYFAYVRYVSDRKRAENALRESEANIRNIYDHAPIGICRMSLDFRFLEVNPEFCRIIGYDQGELLRMTFGEVTYPDDREMCRNHATAVINGKSEYYKIEKRCVRKDGRIIWTRAHGRLIDGLPGQPRYFVTMIEDITDRMQVLDSLQATQMSVDMAADGIVWVSTDGRIVYANDAICRLSGYTRDEMLGKDIFEFSPQFDRAGWAGRVLQFKKEWPFRAETYLVSREGKRTPVELSLFLMAVAGTDYICAYARTVTEPGRAAEIMAANTVRFYPYQS